MARDTTVPTPPRMTGTASDGPILTHWLHSFYKAVVVESGLLDPHFQGTAAAFDPANLPDPEDTSIATAQDTANRAFRRGGMISPYDYDAVGDGVADDSDAVESALATLKHVDLSGGNFRVTRQLVMNDRQWMVNGKITKDHSDDGLDMSAQQSALFHVEIDCNGTLGRGVIISGDGTTALARQMMFRTFITNCVGYALEFTTPHAGAIFGAWDCVFARTDSTLMGVKLPHDTLGTFAGRWFYDTNQGGNAFIDMSGAIGTRLINGNTPNGMIWDADTQYTYIENYRLAGSYAVKGGPTHIRGCQVSGPLTLEGTQHQINDITMQGGTIELKAGATQCTVHAGDAVITDNSGSHTNKLYGHAATFTPTFGNTAVLQPVVTDGTLTGRGAREGNLLKINIDYTVGSLDTFGGAGVYVFSAPSAGTWNLTPQSGISVGRAILFDVSTGNQYRAEAFMVSGDPRIFLAPFDGTGNYWGPAVPIVLAAGDKLDIEIDVQIGA